MFLRAPKLVAIKLYHNPAEKKTVSINHTAIISINYTILYHIYIYVYPYIKVSVFIYRAVGLLEFVLKYIPETGGVFIS